MLFWSQVSTEYRSKPAASAFVVFSRGSQHAAALAGAAAADRSRGPAGQNEARTKNRMQEGAKEHALVS